MRSRILAKCALGLLISGIALGDDVLSTSSFTSCMDGTNSQITVQHLNIQFDRQTSTITFDVAGSSAKVQNVTASLSVSAYGNQVYEKTFDPCSAATRVAQLCPVPMGDFAAQGVQGIPANYASQIPSIAFSIPDLEGAAKLELKAPDDGEDLACIESDVNNGKTMELPAVSYIAVGIAGAALVLTGISALSSTGAVGAHAPSPGFGTCLGWFQSVATNGMLSVNYPPGELHSQSTSGLVYRELWESVRNKPLSPHSGITCKRGPALGIFTDRKYADEFRDSVPLLHTEFCLFWRLDTLEFNANYHRQLSGKDRRQPDRRFSTISPELDLGVQR